MGWDAWDRNGMLERDVTGIGCLGKRCDRDRMLGRDMTGIEMLGMRWK